jgi:N-methylhydantoinase B
MTITLTSSQIDPFTTEIARDGLVAISDEMFAALARTAKSTIIYEVLDFATGITDAQGRLIAQGNGVTLFLGTLSFGVESILAKHGLDAIAPGDVFMTNEPYSGGGTHLSDVSLIVPVFFDDELVAFTASKAHWTEVGGYNPGSWSSEATEIYQEGLQFPCIKLFDAGRLNNAVVDIIESNVRLPDMTLGDMYAQSAAMRLGEKRVHELCAKYGLETVRAAMTNELDYGERVARLALARLPRGTYRATDWIDGHGLGDGSPLPVCVEVTIREDEMVCDFTGSSGEVLGPINCSETALQTGARVAFLAITSPGTAANDGCFRPLTVICPPRTVFSAQRPTSTSTYHEAMGYVTDLIWKALAPLVPDALSAGHFLSVCATIVAGKKDDGELFLMVEPQAGGWGATAFADGQSGLVCVGDGETFVIPTEIAETRYGIVVDEYELHIADAGAGRHRGGRGLVRTYRPSGDEFQLTSVFGRNEFFPWGVDGGLEGSPNEVRVVHADGTETAFGKATRYVVKRGEVARLITGTGGGWGPPLDRPVSDVLEDLADGYVTAAQAERDYGLVVDPATHELVSLSKERRAREREAEAGIDTDG